MDAGSTALFAGSDVAAIPECPPRIGVLSNAGNPRKRERAEDLHSMFRCHRHITHLSTSREDEIGAALTELAALDIDVLVINGGDGTVSHVLTALFNNDCFKVPPTMALLPGGSSNIAVGDVGFRGSLHRAALNLCRWSVGQLSCQVLTRPALRVDVPQLDSALYGLVFGAGAVVEGIDYWHESVKARGMRGPGSSFVAMIGTLRGILRREARFVKPVSVRLGYHGEAPNIASEAMILIASSLDRLFLGVRPYWGEHGDGLHTTVIGSHPQHFLRVLPQILRGRSHPELTAAHGYHSERTRRLALAMSGRFTLDGDIYAVDDHAEPLLLSMGPQLHFLRPC